MTLKNTVKIPSLKNIALEINKPIVNKEDAHNTPLEILQNEFSFETLEILWKNFLKTFKDKGKSSECLILDRPIQLSGFNIVIRLDNVIQIDQLGEFRVELLEYLRKNLKNNLINIQMDIKEESEIKKNIYRQRKISFFSHPKSCY